MKRESQHLPSEFSGYFDLSEERKSQAIRSGIIIFDTSALLGLYRIEPKQRQAVLGELKSRLKGRVWLPHQVFLEFSRHRNDEIEKDSQRVKRIRTSVEQKLSSVRDEVNAQKLMDLDPDFNRSLFESSLDIAKTAILDSISRVEKEYPDLKAHDLVLLDLLELVGSSIGKGFTDQRQIDEVTELGRLRYEKKTPPGYLDEKKDGAAIHKGLEIPRKYGDWIIWRQILEAIGADSQRFKSLIFVTQDQKADWWATNPNNSGEIIGPRLELRQEIENAGVETYWQYTFTQFYQHLLANNSPMTASQTAQIKEIENAERELQLTAVARESLSRGPSESRQYWSTQQRSDLDGFAGYDSQVAVENWLKEIAPSHSIIENASFPDFWVESLSPQGLLSRPQKIGIEVVSPRDPRAAIDYGRRDFKRALYTSSAVQGEVLRTYLVYSLHERAVENYPFSSWHDAFQELQRFIAKAEQCGLAVGVFRGQSFEDVSHIFGVTGPSLLKDLKRLT